MKTIKTIAAVIALSLISTASFAQTITATASTLDGAEAQIAAKAKMAGAGYSITGAYAGNQVHMTARLIK
ncbi:YdgH/BhsA/McbA-like domain containing protein (plasmid) [Enterobacter ludwigii]